MTERANPKLMAHITVSAPGLWLFLTWLALIGTGNAEVIFDFGAPWRYCLGTNEASSPDATAWRTITFKDASWSLGETPIGYANPPGNPDESSILTTLPTSQEGNYLSVFFRKMFVVRNPASITQLTLNINVDDGFVAWINGKVVARYNVPDGELAFNATAVNASEENLISTPITNGLDTLLVAGTNVLAVQVFNANWTSSDFFFNASLASDVDTTPPVVGEIEPAPDMVVQELKQIEIIFDGNVTGVDATDLLINGQPAAKVTAYTPRDYLFEFSQPPEGTVLVTWATNHGITDLASPPNAFGGGSWRYTLDLTPVLASVMISEIMADNQNGIRDDLGNRSDWIELYNRGPSSANLGGWFLTDDTNNLTQWRFPAVNLAPNQYMLVWASGANRTNPSAPLHTNFKLNKDGSYLALLDPWTNVVSAFAPAYPAQRPNISYGRDRLDPTVTGYFMSPTPGAQNTTSGPGFAPEPVFSLESGIYTNSSLSLALSTPAGTIYYTINGSEPTTSSLIYKSPIAINGSLVVKARVFQTGLLPSRMVAKTYSLVDTTARTFTSNLPLLIINTGGRGIPQDQRLTNVSFTVIDTERGRSSLLQTPQFQGLCQIEVRGQSSTGFPKTPYRVEINDEMGNDLNVPILGLPTDADWVLRNPYSDKCMMNDFLACELHEKMGHYATRRRFVEVFLSTSTGKLSYPLHYQGIYLLLEKIEAGKDRVNIEQLTPAITTAPGISGGYIVKKDKPSPGDIVFYTTGGAGFSGQELRYHEPKPREITLAQQNWMRNYLNQFERALYAANWTAATGTNHYSWYIDVDSFVDYHWIVEFSKQIDGYRLSNYMHKDRGGKLFMDPIWDWNLSFGNADYLDGWVTSGWYYALLGENDHIWLRRLICGTTGATAKSGDPDFNQKITDRWSVLRTNILAATNVMARVDEIAAQLNEAAARDFKKFPRLGQYVWPNPSIYVTPTTYQGIINAMKLWIQGRYNWIDSQFVKAPTFNVSEGRIPAGLNLVMSAPAGTIYYTLDATDPRLPGGAVSPRAAVYSGPVRLWSNARAFARAKNGLNWSGPCEATYQVQMPPLVLTEIMYHPLEPASGSTNLPEDFEYLEFKNLGSEPLDLAGYHLGGTVEFTFPKVILPAQQYVLVVKNQTAFTMRYGGGFLIAGAYTGKLGNGAGRLVLQGALQEPIVDVTYNDSWYPITDGAGWSLVIRDEQGPSAGGGQPAVWRPSSMLNGSPGRIDPPPPVFPQVVINEILTHPDIQNTDAIELQNLSTIEANIGGWFLTDHFATPKKFRIPEGVTIAPGGFYVFTESNFDSQAQAVVPFGLSALGEEVYLFSGDAQTNLTGYVHGFKFGAQKMGVTFGRYVNRIGEEHFVAQNMATLGSVNAGPQVGPVVISEIMYHPPDVFTNGAYWNNTEDEYLELYNRSGTPASLYDTNHPANTWRLAKAVEYQFPTNIVLPPGGYVLVVSFNPDLAPAQLAAFRAKYHVPASTLILGPFQRSLNNSGDIVELDQPDEPVASGPDLGLVPWVLVEQIHYSDQPPWPPAADGLGHALNRKNPANYGDDPDNWDSSAPTPGLPYPGGTPPSITSQPQSQIALAGQNILFAGSASGSGLVRYQWRFNGQTMAGATNASLMLTNVQPQQSGSYQLLVLDAASSAASDPAWLTVDKDSDGDGMGDNWELANGLNPYDPADAAEDSDQDGLSNLSEYLAGTDPRDPLSCLKLNGTATLNGINFTFIMGSNRTYTVEFTESLTPADWKTLASFGSRPTNSLAAISDLNTNATRYYRLVTPQKP